MSGTTTIAQVRLDTGLSQSAFAKAYGIPLRTLQQWEQGRSTPPTYVTALLKRAATSGARSPRHTLPPRNHWRVCIDKPFPNCEHIYPIQQKKVAALLEHLKKAPQVKRVIIFGSSVTSRCHIGSDVDVYVEIDGNQPMPELPFFDFPCDIWTNETVDERLLNEIERKGVAVYVRDDTF